MLETITGKYTIKQIFRDNWEKFLQKNEVLIRPAVKENVQRILACGDKDILGYHLYECQKCGKQHFVAHTCKSRFCNSCGKAMTDNWIKNAQKQLINVPYHHLVFSPPSELWLFFLGQPPGAKSAF